MGALCSDIGDTTIKIFGIILLIFGLIAFLFTTLAPETGAIRQVTEMLMIGFGCIIICLAAIRMALAAPKPVPQMQPGPTRAPDAPPSAEEAECRAAKAQFEAAKAERAPRGWRWA